MVSPALMAASTMVMVIGAVAAGDFPSGVDHETAKATT